MTTIKPCEVSMPMLDPTWAPTNNPHAAPAIASPMRSRTWADFLTRNRIVATHKECEEIRLGYFCSVWKVLHVAGPGTAARGATASVTTRPSEGSRAAQNLRRQDQATDPHPPLRVQSLPWIRRIVVQPAGICNAAAYSERCAAGMGRMGLEAKAKLASNSRRLMRSGTRE